MTSKLASVMLMAGLIGVLIGSSAEHSLDAAAKEQRRDRIGLGEGYRPPPFTATDLAGKPHSLEDQKGRVVVLHFWASWCPYCRTEIPELRELHEQWAAKGVRVVTVSIDENVEQLKQFVAEQGLPYPVISDMDLADQYAVSGIPVTYVIAKDGRIVTRLGGAGDIIEAVKRALKS